MMLLCIQHLQKEKYEPPALAALEIVWPVTPVLYLLTPVFFLFFCFVSVVHNHGTMYVCMYVSLSVSGMSQNVAV